MSDMISMAIMLHEGAIVLILLLLSLLVWHFSKEMEFKPFSLQYEKLSLYYRALLATLFFTGLVVMAVAKFDVKWTAYVMLLVILHMIATAIKENILYKKTHLKNLPSQETFKAYAKKKYLVDIIMIVTLSVVTYAVSL